jgi:hypothetical protein
VAHDHDADTLAIETSFAGLSGKTRVAHIQCCTAATGTGDEIRARITLVPEPGTWALMPVGLVGMQRQRTRTG